MPTAWQAITVWAGRAWPQAERVAIVATRLAFDDEVLATVELPGGPLTVWRGLGSGLTRRADDPPGIIWAVGDRGPNLKVGLAVERYGLEALAIHGASDGAKVMPCPEIGTALSELRVTEDRVELLRSFPLRDTAGRALTGLPTPGGTGVAEPAIGLDGQVLAPDPAGADTEGIVATATGFIVGDEYGPSLIHVSPAGEVTARWVPEGAEAGFADARYPVLGVLPAIAGLRRLNRGFEALAAAPDGALLLAFQSPLAHPDEAAHRAARHTRIWKLDSTGAVTDQWLYPFDAPKSFRRDTAEGEFGWSDIKVSEMLLLPSGRLLVLERGSATTKLYLVTLDPDRRTVDAHVLVTTRPTLEEMSASGDILPALEKELLLSTDDLPEIDPDLEGMILLDPHTLLLVNDNDFGVEGVSTRFWRLELDRALT